MHGQWQRPPTYLGGELAGTLVVRADMWLLPLVDRADVLLQIVQLQST